MAGQPRILISEPMAELEACAMEACRAAGVEPVSDACLIDSSEYLHDEASILDEAELGDAEAALVEDRIFSDVDWLQLYLGKPGWPESDRDALLRAAVKYGWALAHLELAMSSLPGAAPVVWSVSEGACATTPLELRFLVSELHRRQKRVELAPCWPVALEPAREMEDERVPFWVKAAEEYAPVLAEGDGRLVMRNAADKLSIVGTAARLFGDRLTFDFSWLALMEMGRVVACTEPALFRRWLEGAQEHFVFDKGRQELATSEDDVHTLPEVSDEELERIFMDDFRGRQLLHVTASSCLSDATLGADLRTACAVHRTAIVERVARCVAERLRLCRGCTPA